MIKTNKNLTKIRMTEGDFGIYINFRIKNSEIIDPNSDLIFLVYKDNETEPIISIPLKPQGTISLGFTQEESNKLKAGTYRYILQWYYTGVFKDTIIPDGYLIIEPVSR